MAQNARDEKIIPTRISVIIPCFNFGHLIGETIQSLLDQTYMDIEILVIDDGSTDQSAEVAQHYASVDERVHYYHFENGGLGTSRNRGLERARGGFIQFLDADDLLEKRKFEMQLKFFSDNPATDVVYGSVRYFEKDPYDENDRRLTYWGVNKEWMPKLSGNGLSILPLTLKGNFSHLSSPLFRRSIVNKVGLFDNSISAVADYHFLLRTVIADAKFLYHDTPETYSLVRWHPDNMSKDPSFMRREEIKMRTMLRPALAFDKQSTDNNEDAIKALTMMVNKSWKTVFLSGGRLDAVKKFVDALGLGKLLRRIFYK